MTGSVARRRMAGWETGTFPNMYRPSDMGMPICLGPPTGTSFGIVPVSLPMYARLCSTDGSAPLGNKGLRIDAGVSGSCCSREKAVLVPPSELPALGVSTAGNAQRIHVSALLTCPFCKFHVRTLQAHGHVYCRSDVQHLTFP